MFSNKNMNYIPRAGLSVWAQNLVVGYFESSVSCTQEVIVKRYMNIDTKILFPGFYAT